MIKEHTSFRLAQQVTDEAFKISQLHDYNLYMALGNRTFRLGVADTQRNKFLVLEDFELAPAYSALQTVNHLRNLFQLHPFMKSRDWKEIRLSVKNQNFTLIPETLYDESAREDYLQLHSELDEVHEKVYSYHHRSIEAVNIFSVDTYLLDWVKESFDGKPVKLLHQTSALIEGVLHVEARSAEKKIYLNVDQNNLTILVAKQGKLHFCNSFYYASAEDFMYYTIFVMQEQQLNPDQDMITLWGDITHDSEIFNMLRKYVRNVKFGKKPSEIAFSYKFDELFEHRFFDLYSMHLCE